MFPKCCFCFCDFGPQKRRIVFPFTTDCAWITRCKFLTTVSGSWMDLYILYVRCFPNSRNSFLNLERKFNNHFPYFYMHLWLVYGERPFFVYHGVIACPRTLFNLSYLVLYFCCFCWFTPQLRISSPLVLAASSCPQ
mgnify:CR=1 FL=1